MALIKCRECGKEISDKATQCIYCGAPLKYDQSVKIKIPKFTTGMFLQKISKTDLYINDNLIWSGYSDQVAEFKVDCKTSVIIKIKKAYTRHLFPLFRNFKIIRDVEPGKKYEIKMTKISILFGDPSRSKYVFSNVDVIDSGL